MPLTVHKVRSASSSVGACARFSARMAFLIFARRTVSGVPVGWRVMKDGVPLGHFVAVHPCDVRKPFIGHKRRKSGFVRSRLAAALEAQTPGRRWFVAQSAPALVESLLFRRSLGDGFQWASTGPDEVGQDVRTWLAFTDDP